MTFQGKVVCVTGGAQGLGAAIAEQFAEQGAHVSVADRDVAATVDSEQRRHFGCDVTSESDVERWVGQTLDNYGKIDVLINCAGTLSRAPVHEITSAEWDRVFAVNVRGTFLPTRSVLQVMLKQPPGGVIINIASQAGVRVEPLMAHYSASKAAIIQFTKSVALEYAPHVRCNTVSPGLVETTLVQRSLGEYARTAGISYAEAVEQRKATIPMKRFQTAHNLADGVLFLASERASEITGVNLDVTGGELIPR